jgi:hypothetical protein
VTGALPVAYHEAGHAVACLASRLAFESVTTIPDGRIAGCIRITPGQQSHGDIEFVWVAASGVIADRIKRGRDDFTINTIRNWHRYGWLQPDILELTNEFPDKQELLALVLCAVELTRHHWPRVEAIAQTLIVPRTISYAEAKDIFDGAQQ